MVSLFCVLALVAGVNGIRTFCGGGQCNFSSDCRMPNGISTIGTVTGLCCNGICCNGGYGCCNNACVATIPVVAKGGACNNTDTCMMCASGLSCRNAQGELFGIGTGPYTCQPPVLTKWTTGCRCDNNSQCIGNFCGSNQGVCLAGGLYVGAGCQFSSQCLSGWCDNGHCRGREVNVPNTCGSNDQCPNGYRCSSWGVPPTSQCHGLSNIGGFCYTVEDCKDYYSDDSFDSIVECVGASTSVTGRCTANAGLGEICKTTTTTQNCAFFDQQMDGYTSRTRYYCNDTKQPPRCEAPPPTVGVGSRCDNTLTNVSKCNPTLYCQLDSTQPTFIYPSNPGTCATKYNIPLGSNCSDISYACTKPNLCQRPNSSMPYVCTAPVNSLGKPCNHTSPTFDSVQCPNTGATLYCACNDTCSLPSFTSNNIYCTNAANIEYNAILNDLPEIATPALAMYDGSKQRLIADHLCCNYCDDATSLLRMASDTGVVVDCAGKSLRQVEICNTDARNEPYLQGCDQFKSAGVMATFSVYLIALLFIVRLLI